MSDGVLQKGADQLISAAPGLRMDFSQFEEHPGAFVFSVLFSAVLTAAIYGAFPVIYAKKRQEKITRRHFKWMCWGVNLIPKGLFMLGGSKAYSYWFWTSIFVSKGSDMLTANYYPTTVYWQQEALDNCVDIKWGNWKGADIDVTIIPKKTGVEVIKFTNSTNEREVRVIVIVSD